MEPIQGVVIMLALLALALAPAVWQRARQLDRAEAQRMAELRQAGELPVEMTPVQSLARMMYGEAYGWGSLDMLNYDNQAWVREPWERAAQGKMDKAAHPAAG